MQPFIKILWPLLDLWYSSVFLLLWCSLQPGSLDWQRSAYQWNWSEGKIGTVWPGISFCESNLVLFSFCEYTYTKCNCTVWDNCLSCVNCIFLSFLPSSCRREQALYNKCSWICCGMQICHWISCVNFSFFVAVLKANLLRTGFSTTISD